MTTVWVDGVPLEQMRDQLEHQRAQRIGTTQGRARQQFYSSPARPMESTVREVVEITFPHPKQINYLTFDVARFPHRAEVEWYVEGEEAEGLAYPWVEVGQVTVTDSHPISIPTIPPPDAPHPQHFGSLHWVRYARRVEPFTTQRLRVALTRIAGIPPVDPLGDPVPYSLALRRFDVGYRVREPADVPVGRDTLFATTRNLFGQLVEYRLRKQAGEDLTSGGVWRSNPQPMTRAVVNLYVDLRTAEGVAQVVDRLQLDPIYTGAALNLYTTEDTVDGDATVADLDRLTWRPVPRDYQVHRSPLDLPPTRATFVKLEFTNLTPVQHENFLAQPREVAFHGPETVRITRQPTTGAGGIPQGAESLDALVRSFGYGDAPVIGEIAAPGQPRPGPADALVATDPAVEESLRQASWRFGFTDWHQGYVAPRHQRTGRHRYETAEVAPTTKLAYFAGLATLAFHRRSFTVAEDTPVYFEHFDDDLHLSDLGNWTLRDGGLVAQGGGVATAVSEVFESIRPVDYVQFASQQSPVRQIAFDDDLADPALTQTQWNDPGTWHAHGVADLSYDQTRQVIRVDRRGPFTDPAETAEAGLESKPILYRHEGYAYAAARVIAVTDLTEPVVLQIVDIDGNVVAERSQTAQAGQTIEWWVGWDIAGGSYSTDRTNDLMVRSLVSPLPGEDPPAATSGVEGTPAVRIRVIQKAATDDVFEVDTLSLFTQPIVWHFSVDGGVSWLAAGPVRNNADGLVRFPEPGTQLRWKVEGHLDNVTVSSLQIRPHYQGQRPSAVRPWRGANLSTYDQYLPIREDPEFTEWTLPIPRWWFMSALARRRRPVVATRLVEVLELVPEPLDEAIRHQWVYRYAFDDLGLQDDATRRQWLVRHAGEDLPVPQDTAVSRSTWDTLVRPLVYPVGGARYQEPITASTWEQLETTTWEQWEYASWQHIEEGTILDG